MPNTSLTQRPLLLHQRKMNLPIILTHALRNFRHHRPSVLNIRCASPPLKVPLPSNGYPCARFQVQSRIHPANSVPIRNRMSRSDMVNEAHVGTESDVVRDSFGREAPNSFLTIVRRVALWWDTSWLCGGTPVTTSHKRLKYLIWSASISRYLPGSRCLNRLNGLIQPSRLR
jgi:hypothetical protein